ncbi:MAG: histone deacetylase family protein [Rhodobacteraceae bacterium]|nr:histone deacetylase family protein [Paracoccaceae bacterium]
MTTALISHVDCMGHRTPPGHPERTQRLESISRKLSERTFSSLLRLDAPVCSNRDILHAHSRAHLGFIEISEPRSGWRSLDADTHMSAGSFIAAKRAVGAICRAVDLVVSGEIANAFCAVRPPGHHAEVERAMGFCLFSNVAIGALHAKKQHGLERVAILDFDVHHGNGTSNILWDEESVLFASTHEMPLYPGTGFASERGRHNQIINMPLQPRSGSRPYREAIEIILERMDAFRPQLVIVSAGFDAHYRDPLATLRLSEEDFSWTTERVCDIADLHCSGRVLSSLEGGYDLVGLTDSVAAHVKVLMDRGA